MKTLFTAFKGVYNTSFQLVYQIDRNSLFLTNSFNGLEKDISFVADNYNAVYMFGVDKTLGEKIRIETCANFNNEIVNTNFDIQSLGINLRSKSIHYSVSNAPTHYLCNAAYYHMLKKNKNTVFIHIPSLSGMSVTMMDSLVAFFGGIYSNENRESSNPY